MKKIKLSFLGLGVVGSQLMTYMQREKYKILKEYQVELVIDKVFVRDMCKKRSIDVSGLELTDNPYEAIAEADIIFECLGGNALDVTKELILFAVNHKKTIIMSSKKCLAFHGEEITKTALLNNMIFYYDATVGGGIPISTILTHMGKCEQIERIYGICNATSNYVLYLMGQHHMNYEEALQCAQKNGYAENNPAEDVDGYDALYKSTILMGVSMGKWLDCRTIQPQSIRQLSETDIRKANEQNCVIKPVFCITGKCDEYSCAIGPKFIEKDNIMAVVNGNNNIIVICGSESGERAFIGQGAGAQPTASAMFDDFVKAINERYDIKR